MKLGSSNNDESATTASLEPGSCLRNQLEKVLFTFSSWCANQFLVSL